MIRYSRDHKELLSVILLGVSAVSAALIVVEASSFFVVSARANSRFSNISVFTKPSEQEVQKYLADDKSLADKLKKQNLFAPPSPKENPIKEVPGIMGNEAWINGGWHKVGESIGDAKIVAIEPTQVKILWNGQESIFTPITAVGSSGSSGPGAGPRGGEGPRRSGPDMVMVAGPGSRGPGTQGISGMPSSEDMARTRDRFSNMSDAERQAFREQMRAQFGDRGGGPGGRGGGGGRRGGD